MLLNIGNTHTQLAEALPDGSIQLLKIYDTPSLLQSGVIPQLESLTGNWTITVSSVVPAVSHLLVRRYGTHIRLLSAADFPWIDFSQVDTSTLGIDRICTAAAALALVDHGPVIALDCGTCLVTEVIDASHRFRGGTIAPGRMLLRQALADHTAALPLIPLQNESPAPLGTNTSQAILAGVDGGVIGMVEKTIRAIQTDIASPECPVLATGGDAPFFLNKLPKLLTPAPPYLTLRGIHLAEG